MHNRSKKPVWALFKILEIFLSSACCYRHLFCYLEHQIPNVFILCATYASGVLLGVAGLVGSLFYERVAHRVEALMSGTMGTLNMITVYVHMYLLEHNQLMSFLREQEQEKYAFLICCKSNATWAWFAVGLYYLHCSFALDMVFNRRTVRDKDNEKVRSRRRLKLYFISKSFERYVSRYRWFKLLSANIKKKAHIKPPSQRRRMSTMFKL
ncbi:uncharacterized protein Dmoj_GI20498 [Drosophila mojavensis]|uniref:DUF7775 domain-containing protein n=1 Tax=Drosophila mojavensis TaxID=7230 RepID=B4KRZ2_DROMO|nr:uncharacterized protein Dmoj_GI20498 [Drosophila mojavensis]